MDKIIPAFEKTLLDPSIPDVGIDVAEIGIDSILDCVLDSVILEGIPLAKLFVGGVKTAQNIHDRNLLRQTLNFIKAFNEENLSEEQINAYRNHLSQDSKYAEAELGRIIILLNATIDLKKSTILGKLFSAYVAKTINWNTLCEYTDVVSRLFVSDLALLNKIHIGEITETNQCPRYQAERIRSLGLLNSTMSTVAADYMDYYITTNSFGNTFCKIIFK